MPLAKPWQSWDPSRLKKIPGTLGVFEIGDANGAVLYIGMAGGRTRFGLRERIADCFAGTVAPRWVPLVYVVVIAFPLKETEFAATNPVPAIATGVAGPFTIKVLGVTAVTVTFGFETTNAIDEEVPPPGAGLVRVTG